MRDAISSMGEFSVSVLEARVRTRIWCDKLRVRTQWKLLSTSSLTGWNVPRGLGRLYACTRTWVVTVPDALANLHNDTAREMVRLGYAKR